MDKEEKNKQKLIKKLLALHLGLEVDDISNEDFLKEDLHMDPLSLTDFSHILEKNSFDIDSIDFSEIETVNDLIENLI